MFTRISNTLAGVLAGINSQVSEASRSGICLFENDPAAQAHLQTRPKRKPPPADFELDIGDV
jgi:hypothetical protein